MLKFGTDNVLLDVGKYVYNDSLAILMVAMDDGSPYGDLTKCIDDTPDENCAFVDANNLGEQVVRWIIKNNLGEPTGRFGHSGFCFYPEIKFNMNEINKHLL